MQVRNKVKAMVFLVCVMLAFPSVVYANPSKKLAAYIQSVNPKVSNAMAATFAKSIIGASKKYNVKPEHLVAMMRVESTYKKGASSKCGAMGLMQINPRVWCSIKNPDNLMAAGIIKHASDLWNPAKNIVAGAYILRYYLNAAEKKKAQHPLKMALRKYSGYTPGYFSEVKKAVQHFKQFSQSDES